MRLYYLAIRGLIKKEIYCKFNLFDFIIYIKLF